MKLTEEQKNLTLGQVEEMKSNLQNEIANVLQSDGIHNFSKNFEYRIDSNNESVLTVADDSNVEARSSENLSRDFNLTNAIMNKINDFYNMTGIQVSVMTNIVHNWITDINGNYIDQYQPVVTINL